MALSRAACCYFAVIMGSFLHKNPFHCGNHKLQRPLHSVLFFTNVMYIRYVEKATQIIRNIAMFAWWKAGIKRTKYSGKTSVPMKWGTLIAKCLVSVYTKACALKPFVSIKPLADVETTDVCKSILFIPGIMYPIFQGSKPRETHS